MSDYNEIDNLFKSELTPTKVFDNKETQWEIVYSKLNKRSKNRLLWFFPFLGLALLSLYYGKTLLNPSMDDVVSINSPIANEDINASAAPENTFSIDSKDQNSPQSTKDLAIINNDSDAKRSNYNDSIKFKLDENKLSKSIQEKEEEEEEEEETDITDKPSNSNFSSETNSYASSTTTSTSNNYNSIQKLDLSENSIVSNPLGDQNVILKESTEPTFNSKNTISIATIKTLGIKPFEYKHEITPPILYPIKKSKTTQLLFSVDAGIFLECIQQDSLQDSPNLGWNGGITMKYSKVLLKLAYRKNNIERSINSALGAYNIVDTNFVYGVERPDVVNLAYSNHYIDLSIGYTLISRGRINWELASGIQARKISSGKIKFEYGGVYNPIEFETDIKSDNFQLSNLLLGSRFRYTLYNRIGLSFEYNLAIPLEIDAIKWPKRHQFGVAISYYLN